MSIEQVANSATKSEQVKKGTRSWTPSNLGDVVDKEPGYRYRWVRKDQDNIAKKLEEQWETVSTLNDKAAYDFPTGRPNEGHGLSSVVERRDGILMRMPEDIAEQRDAFVNSKTERYTKALRAQARKDLAKEGAVAHGSINIEHKGVRTVIE